MPAIFLPIPGGENTLAEPLPHTFFLLLERLVCRVIKNLGSVRYP